MIHRKTINCHAFTLIELLVVVAIIGLLVSILLPSLKSARDQGRQVVCLSNLRSQTQVANLYADDNSDILIAGLLQSIPPSYLGQLPGPMQPNFNSGQGMTFGLAPQFWLPYLDYQIPMDNLFPDAAADIERRRWQNLFGGPLRSPLNMTNSNVYRNNENWQGRMGDAFATIKVYQCPSFPPVLFEDGSNVSECELDYLTNTMPDPMTSPNLSSRQNRRFNPSESDPASGVGIGTVHYFCGRVRSRISNPSQLWYIGEIDESLVKRDLQDGARGREARLSFIFNSVFTMAHMPNAYEPRMDNDYDDGEHGRKRHPGGTTLGFFDGHAEVMAYDKLDPGENATVGERLRYFSDIRRLTDAQRDGL